MMVFSDLMVAILTSLVEWQPYYVFSTHQKQDQDKELLAATQLG